MGESRDKAVLSCGVQKITEERGCRGWKGADLFRKTISCFRGKRGEVLERWDLGQKNLPRPEASGGQRKEFGVRRDGATWILREPSGDHARKQLTLVGRSEAGGPKPGRKARAVAANKGLSGETNPGSGVWTSTSGGAKPRTRYAISSCCGVRTTGRNLQNRESDYCRPARRRTVRTVRSDNLRRGNRNCACRCGHTQPTPRFS